MKKEWSTPEVKNLLVNGTCEDISCPMEGEARHPDGIILPQCYHYCETHKACGLKGVAALAQLICPRQIAKPIKNCGCKPHSDEDEVVTES